MIRKLGTILTFYMSSFVICETKYSYINYDVNHAIEYLQGYTGMSMDEVLFLSSTRFSVDQEALVDEIKHSLLNQSNVRYIVSMTMEEYTSHLIFKAIQSTFSSVVIFPDFANSTDVQKAFFDFPDQVTKDNTFLILLSADYESQEEMFTFVFNLILIYPNYLSKFSLNSHVYAIGRINQRTRLIEIYQRCHNNQISIRELSSIPNHERNQKYVWENRKDLSHCTIKIGYMIVKPHLMVLTNQSLRNQPSDIQLSTNKRVTLYSSGLTWYGYSVPLFSLVQSILNFSIEWVHVNDEKYGSFDSDRNEWNGIVGMVKRNEIDTSILDLTISADRKSVISYSSPTVKYHLGLFLRKPGPSWSWTTFVNVFNHVYWLAVCSFISFLLYVYIYYLFTQTWRKE